MSAGDRLQTMARRIAGGCVGLRARRLNRLVTRIYEDALRPHGLTAAQLHLLVGIALGGPLPAVALGRILDLEKSTLSRNLARMVAKGWVVGARALELTPAGERLLERAFPAWEAAQRRVKQRVGGDAIQLLDGMTGGAREP